MHKERAGCADCLPLDVYCGLRECTRGKEKGLPKGIGRPQAIRLYRLCRRVVRLGLTERWAPFQLLLVFRSDAVEKSEPERQRRFRPVSLAGARAQTIRSSSSDRAPDNLLSACYRHGLCRGALPDLGAQALAAFEVLQHLIEQQPRRLGFACPFQLFVALSKMVDHVFEPKQLRFA